MKKSRKRWLIGLGVLAGVIIVWGFIEPYLIDIQEEDVMFTTLPSELEGEKIVVIGDFQVGLWMDNISTTERIVEDVIEMNPSALLITGDYFYHVESIDDQEINEIMDALRPLEESGIPVYSVLGNHDYAMLSEEAEPNIALAEELADELSSLGIRMLDNDNEVLADGDDASGDFYIVGIGSHWAKNDFPKEAFEGVPEDSPRLVLMHNPDSFKLLEADTAPLAVAGHTHGGQIRTPFSTTWSYLSMVQKGEVTADGWIEDYGSKGNSLYVNRGVGMSLVPIRMNAVPEITVFTVTSNN